MNNLSLEQAREILEVDSLADEREIKTSYRKLALKHHPDHGGDAHEFNRIREAYDRLTKTPLSEIVANDIEAMIFDDIFNSWLENQDESTQETIRRQVDKVEKEAVPNKASRK